MSLLNKVSLFILLIFSSCNTEVKTENETVKIENTYKSGKTYENIICRKDSTQKYIAFFPESYSKNKETAVIVVFDAHARAELAIDKFKDAANQYNYLIIASENIKNGLITTDHSVNMLFDDVFSRFKIDKKRVYTAGFSGGAKVASSVAIYKGGIAGVIACSSRLTETGIKISNKFDFVGLVGLKDFNYQEMRTLCEAYDNVNINNKLITFNGSHEWPGSDIIIEAVEYLDIMAIKRKIIPANDNFIRTYSQNNAEKINKLIINGEDYKAHILYKNFLNSLSGLYDISDYQKSYLVLLESPKIEKGINLEIEISKAEYKKQNELFTLFKNSNFKLIKNEITTLKGKIKSEPLNYLNTRLVNYSEMLCYIFTDNSLKQRDLKILNLFLSLYEFVNPKNADKEFFKACSYALSNNLTGTIKSLNKALDFGFYDKDKLQNSLCFEKIKNSPEFIEILSRIK